MIGEPSSVLIAAKLPADATTLLASSGASLLARPMASAASPPPSKISGISGPSTIPKHKVASPAATRPGKCAAVGG